MFGWLRKKGNPGLEQLASWLKMLETADGEELALTVVFATHFRNEIAREGLDLRYPTQVLIQDPNVIQNLITSIHQLQASGQEPMAAGLMVWVHTLRASKDLEVRPFGRRMWAALSRSFPYVEQTALACAPELDIGGYDTIPEGLHPQPK